MKNLKLTTLVISTLITFTSVTACMNKAQRPEGAVDITQEEIDIIETMQAEGAEEKAISEALIAYETEQSTSDEAEESEETDASCIITEVSFETCSDAEDTQPATIPGGISIPASTSTEQVTTAESTTVNSEEPSNDEEYTLEDTIEDSSDYCEFLSDCEEQCIQYINEARKQEAFEDKYTWYCPIVRNQSLTDKCHVRCYEIIDDFSHESVSGTDLGGECIYRGTASGEFAYNVYNAWINSPGHRKSLLCGCVGGDQRYESYSAGVGILRSSDGYIYAVYGLGSGNEGTPPSSGYVLAEDEHMHHYDIYVRTDVYGTQWLVVYACECGDECGWIVDEDPCIDNASAETEATGASECNETEPAEPAVPTIDPDEIEI